MQLKDKTIFITGGSRGIGKAIALRCAREGANIVIAAKTTEPHPKLEGTIFSAAQEIEAAGGNVLAVKCDVREEQEVVNAVAEAVNKFGGIDVLINNASAISLLPGSLLPLKQFDLMQQINVRGTYLVTRHCIPHLRKSKNAHVLVLSPPLNMDKKWLAAFAPYTISKYGMSMLVSGFAAELKKDQIAVNALWPRTTIATAAIQNIVGGEEMMKRSRKPEIMADAAFAILKKGSDVSGNFFIDEDVLRDEGVSNFEHYAVDPTQELQLDLFL